MDRSLSVLLQQQEKLLQILDSPLSPSQSPRPTKESQIQKQYEPFQRLAAQARVRQAHHAQEIDVLRNKEPPSIPRNLAAPTRALVWASLLVSFALFLVETVDPNVLAYAMFTVNEMI